MLELRCDGSKPWHHKLYTHLEFPGLARATDQKPQASQDLRHLLAVSQTMQPQSTTT